jgi:hypothetical protein
MSEKKLSYKPGIALFLWSILIITLTIQNAYEIRQLAGADAQLWFGGLLFGSLVLFMAAAAQTLGVSGYKQYQQDLIYRAKVNEDHLCPDCAKYMNDNKYKISRI